MPLSFSAGVRDSLSNLAASLGVGRDKAAHDAFGLRTLERAQIEALYRGDWLARKVVDIVPYDSIRAWRAWSGHRADIGRMEAAERRLGLRKAIQRAMVLGRLYGGGAILIGTGESDPAALARPLDERLPRGGLAFLHVVSRWQLGVAALDADPLSPWCGEPALYELSAPGRPALALHPSRVVRFLGHPLPDPTLAPSFWSDSVLQVLYDAVHAVALTTAGATSLMHEAKVDIVTVPNLSEHLSSAETTEQLSARFAYAAAMKSINNLLLLGDGESWSRQSVDFAGLPEMVRTFLQVAAGAADIPVTRLLGQSSAGLSATGGTGAWAGKDLNVAAWQDGAWAFYAPNPGFVAYVDALGSAVMWNGAAWVSLLGAVTALALNVLGIGTAADPANPLSAKLNAALFAALPTGASPAGTGDVRVKLSKQAVGNTASLLFQDNYSGRAEIGLAGDDNFHVKVSPDGSTFYDALMVTAAGGAVSFLATPTAPTPAAGDNSTKLATTAYADRAASAGNLTRKQVSDAAYTVLPTDRVVAVVALTAARTLTLPAASVYPQGATLTVIDESGACSAANVLTIAAAGSDAINGAGSAVLARPYGVLALESNGSNKWTVVEPLGTLVATNSGSTNNSASGAGTAVVHTPTVTLPAGFLQAGRAIRVLAGFRLTTGSAPGTLTIQLRLGATIIATLAATTPTASRTNVGFGETFVLQATAAPSAASSVECQVFGNANAVGAAAGVVNEVSGPVSLATNGALALNILTIWSAAGTGTSTIQLTQLVVEALN